MGHLFRALNLARALRGKGNDVTILVNEDEPSLTIIRENSFPVETIPSYEVNYNWESDIIEKYRPQWWINDRLDTTLEHARIIRNAGIRLITFDDHGEGARLAEFNVLAIDLWAEEKAPNGLYGPEYIILDKKVEDYRELRKDISAPADILITLGGSDTYGVTPRALQAIGGLLGEVKVGVVIGPGFEHLKDLNSVVEGLRSEVKIHKNVSDLLRLIAESDILICGGGITLFEAAALGKPALAIANEPHESRTIQWFAENGSCIDLGFHEERFDEKLIVELKKLLEDKSLLRRMGDIGKSLVDGRGLYRILSILEEVS